MKLRAPAKVNLDLRILQRRADGFHEIESLIVPVSLADELTVSTSLGRTVKIQCDYPGIPLGDDNLATRAAHLFAQQTGLQFGVTIAITKRIPPGAGLGGGSSDAAAVLVALDAIFETHLTIETLETLAGKLGSDVPFFIRRTPAYCRGRGERIDPFKLPEKLHLLLIKPPFGVDTPWAYKNWKNSRSLPDEYEKAQSLGWISLVNSLERPVFEKYLLLPVMKKWLLDQPETRAAAMSGSGSTMFAVLKSEADAAPLEKRVREVFGGNLWTAACETLV